MKAYRVAIVLFAALAAAACDTDPIFEEDEIVVEAYLEAGELFGEVRLSRLVDINDLYDFTASAVTDAVVEIRMVPDEGEQPESIPYAGVTNLPGVYQVVSTERVQPLATYELVVQIPSAGKTLRSRTTVPGDFRVVSFAPDTVVYQGGAQIEVQVTRSLYPGRQSIFVFSTQGLDPHIPNLTPFYREVIDPDNDDDEDELDEYLINESPPLNEDAYDVLPDGTLSIKVPWLAFVFYGPNRLMMNAIDENLFDFVRSHQVQQGGSTLAPGEIPNVIDHVDGGLGVFGSYARSEIEVEILRP